MDPPPFFHHPPRYVPLSPPPQSFSGDPKLGFHHPPQLPYHHLPPPPPPPCNPQFTFTDDYPRRYVRVPPEHRLDLEPRFRFRDGEFSPHVNFYSDYHRNIDCYEPNMRNYDYAPAFRDNMVENDTRINGFVNSDAGLFERRSDVFRENIVENDTRINGFVNSDAGFFERRSDVFRENIVENDTRINGFVNSDADFFERRSDVFRENIVENDARINSFINSDVFRDNIVENDTRVNSFVNGDVGSFGRGSDIYGSSSNLNDFSDRARKEIFNSPNKQVQKKSALLRIQFNKSQARNNRNEGRRVHLDTRTDELDMKSFKSRGSDTVEERDGSSVELDVSFKSNSLVAKAIEVEHGMKSTSKKRKIANSRSKKSSDGGRNLKKKVVRPMSCVSIPEREEGIEPVKKHGLLKSVVVSPQLVEDETKLNDKNATASVGVDKSDPQPSQNTVEEDFYVDIGGSPMRSVKGKSDSSQSPPSVKRTSIVDSPVSGDKSDDSHNFKSCEKTYFEVVSNVDNNVTCPAKTTVWEGHEKLFDKSSDEHINLISDKSQLDMTISDINAVDSVSETNKAAVVPESFTSERFSRVMTLDGGNSHVDVNVRLTSVDRKDVEIDWNLVTPSTVDMFLKEVSEATPVDKSTLSSPPNDHIFREQHIMISGTEEDSICRSSSLSLNSRGSDSSSERTSSSNETSSKYGKTGKVFASVSSSSMLSEEDEEDSVSSGTFTSGAELPANTDEECTRLEDRDVGSKFDTFSSVRSSPCSESGILLVENIGAGVSFEDRGLIEDITENSLQAEKGSFRHISDTEKSGDGKENDAVEEQGLLCPESFQHRNSSEADIDTYQKPPVSDSLPSFPTDLSLCPDGQSSLLNRLSHKRLDSESEPESDKVFNSGSQATLPVSTEPQIFKTEIGLGQISEGMDWEVLSNQDKKPSVEGPSVANSVPTLQSTSTNKNSGHAMGTVNSSNFKFVSSMRVGVNTSKNLLPPAVPKSFRTNSSTTKTAPISQNLKWQRSSSPTPPLIPVSFPSSVYRRAQSPTIAGNIPSGSYVRQGNSLVRKTPQISATLKDTRTLCSSVSWLNPSGIDKTKNITGSNSKVNFHSAQSSLRTEHNATLVRPGTPPLPCSTKNYNYPNLSSGSATSAPLVDPLQNVCSETELDPLKLKENTDLFNLSNGISEISASHECLSGQIDSFKSPGIIEGNLVPTNTRKLEYVKRKANQLVAACSSGLSAQNADKNEALSSAGYFKNRENQLVRKSMDFELKIGMPDEKMNSQAKSASQIIASSFQKRSGKGFGKGRRPSRFSLVWTPHDAESMKKNSSFLNQVWPHLFPWKRATHRRRFTYNQASIADNGSLPSISRKLLLSRQRKTIYKRGPHGLSLSISKVLSVSGTGLKWSKSIEKNCRKVNEEATLAVADVERKKREKGVVTARTKSRSHTPRERIFRVGSVRYKMDPTRRTLQRISDEESSCSLAVQSGIDVKKSSFPRRLVIGNREYVRIGNGNQLIRDPKKRIRILANEKVRWSLHTARLSLARKKTYCQFFTRFGKCNKAGGKCPYIHDPEKIAVCTKFLMGSCSDSNCKLTHKVIPERMQDCSYFLQGLCSNETCPYRHVNVNPNASICDGFLKGYCAEGNECRKKHSYVCSTFESTGACPQRSTCKLHHPKNQNKGKRSVLCNGKNNFRGRYFGSKHISVSDTKLAVSSKPFTKDDDNMFFEEGKFADFIPLDVSDEKEDEESFDSTLEQKSSSDTHPMDVDIDDLIKPVGIMKKKLMKDASPTV